jgi:hypothetical protein
MMIAAPVSMEWFSEEFATGPPNAVLDFATWTGGSRYDGG